MTQPSSLIGRRAINPKILHLDCSAHDDGEPIPFFLVITENRQSMTRTMQCEGCGTRIHFNLDWEDDTCRI